MANELINHLSVNEALMPEQLQRIPLIVRTQLQAKRLCDQSFRACMDTGLRPPEPSTHCFHTLAATQRYWNHSFVAEHCQSL